MRRKREELCEPGHIFCSFFPIAWEFAFTSAVRKADSLCSERALPGVTPSRQASARCTRDAWIERPEAKLGAGQPDLSEPGTNGRLTGDQGGASGRAALLAVPVGEDGAFLADAIDMARGSPSSPCCRR